MSLDSITGRENFADLPFIQLPPVPLPDDHPDVEFQRDIAALARMERRLWSAARNIDGDPKPAIPDLDLLCDFIPGCEIELELKDDMKAFAKIGDDISAAFAGVRR